MNCFFFLPDDTTLVTVVPLHVEVTVVSDGKNMRRQFTNLLIGVLSNLVCCVDRQQLVRVHSHQDGASVRLQREEHDVQRKRPNKPFWQRLIRLKWFHTKSIAKSHKLTEGTLWTAWMYEWF